MVDKVHTTNKFLCLLLAVNALMVMPDLPKRPYL